MSPEMWCPFNRSVAKKRFRCSQLLLVHQVRALSGVAPVYLKKLLRLNTSYELKVPNLSARP